jgi:hypothetical protein
MEQRCGDSNCNMNMKYITMFIQIDGPFGIKTSLQAIRLRSQASAVTGARDFCFPWYPNWLLVPTHPPTLWVLKSLSPWVKRLGH